MYFVSFSILNFVWYVSIVISRSFSNFWKFFCIFLSRYYRSDSGTTAFRVCTASGGVVLPLRGAVLPPGAHLTWFARDFRADSRGAVLPPGGAVLPPGPQPTWVS